MTPTPFAGTRTPEAILDSQIPACTDNFTHCCAGGYDCGPDACNAADNIANFQPCNWNCRTAFLGFEPVDTDCAQPDVPYGCLAEAIERCKVGGYDEAGNEVLGCADQCASAECVPVCESACLPKCAVSQCVAQDFEGQCEETCNETCIDGGRAPGSPPTPRYGHPVDLNFNIVRVFDGAGQLYLQNTYGTDPASPDFDTVTLQQFGEYQPKLARADLVTGPANLPAWAQPLVQTQAAFQPVDICPYTCQSSPINNGDLAVPNDGLLLIFQQTAVTSPVTGFTTTKVLSQRVWPTLVTFTRNAQGTVVGAISRRTSTTNYLATTATSIPLTLNSGATVTLATSTTGTVTVTGTTAGKDQLVAMGTMTLLTDASKHVLSYPGVPVEALQVTSGSCTQPFTVQSVSDTEVKFQPATACQGDLWLTPIGGPYPNQSQAANFPRDGLSALSTSAFHPIALSPSRGGFIWRSGIDGRRVREAPPTGLGQTDSGKAAAAQYAKAPIFSAPTTTSGVTEPLFVFHWVSANYTVTSPPPIPSDQPWLNNDPALPMVPLPCDATLPEPAIHGGGARPKQATAIVDFHGARWTYYSDDHNRVLRTINYETNAVWSFNYDPIGQLIGIEAPDLSRTCLVYDSEGNVKREILMPATVAGLPTPDPIRQEFGYDSLTSRPTSISDPRWGTTFRQITRDDHGNPTSIVEADGTTTNLYRVADGGPADDAIARIVRPGGVETLIGYDVPTGTQSTVTTDATGALPMMESIDHDDAGRAVAHENALGMLETRAFDGGQLALVGWSGDGHSGQTTLNYDGAARLASVLVGTPGAERLRQELTYSVTGAPTKTKLIALDGTAATVTTCQDIAPGDRLRESVSGEGIRLRYTYDGDGNVTSIIGGDLGPSPRTWDDGCLDHPTGGAGQFTLGTFTYDANGRLIAATDERGQQTTVIRDGFGRPIMENRPDGVQLRRGYDAFGNAVWEAVYSTANAPGYRPPSWTDGALQSATEMVYDNRNRLTDVKRWHFSGAQVAVGDGYATTHFAYDDVAHTVTRTDDGNNAWITRYDGAGRVVEERGPDGTARTYTYLADRRTVRISEPSPTGTITQEIALTAWGDVASEGPRVGAATFPTATNQFDELLRPVATTSLTGAIESVTYDAFGRTSRQIQTIPGGASETVATGYDRDGRVVSRTSTADGATTGGWAWHYDFLGRQNDATDPSGRHTTTTYVVGSQLPNVVTDVRGVQFQHSWTLNANQLFLNAVDPSGPDVSLAYTWDGRGNLISTSRTDEGSTAVTNTFEYDSLSDRTKETDNQLPSGWTRTTNFDGRGLPTKTWLNTSTLTRTFDAFGRLANIKYGSESTPLATYTYSGFGYRLTRALSNGITTTYGYDALGRLASQGDVNSGGTLASWAWQLPLDGVPRRAEFHRGAAADKSVFTTDAASRLLDEDNASTATFSLSPTTTWSVANSTAAASLGAQDWKYTLDGRSAWSRRVRGTSGTTDYLRDARDALTRIGTTNTTLDLRGAITNDGSLQVTYDAVGQVKQVTTAPNSRTYKRDALGRVVSETNQSGQVTRYAWDGSTRIVRQRADGTTFDISVDGANLDEHVAVITGSSRQFLLQDRRNSVYAVTNNTGAVTEWASYTAYGEPTLRDPATGAVRTNTTVNAQYGFNGLPHDFVLGTVDMRARVYRPTLGRFLSPDPLGLIDGTNRFGFVGASPLSLSDPSGLCSQDPSMVCTNYDPTGNPDAEGLAINAGIAGGHWDDQMHAFHAGRAAQEAAAEQRRVDDVHAAGRYFRRVYNVVTTSLTVATMGLTCATAPWTCAKGIVKSFVFASLTSSGGFDGMGMIVGVLGGATSLGRGAVVADLETASVDAVAADTQYLPTNAPTAYSTAYQTELSPSSYPGLSRGMHFREANENLLQDIARDPDFAQHMENLGIRVDRTATGLAPTTPPAGWTWHHEFEPGLMRLVPRAQHTGSVFSDIFHPGGRGGFSIWGR